MELQKGEVVIIALLLAQIVLLENDLQDFALYFRFTWRYRVSDQTSCVY